jgi:antirestriction protein
MTLKCEIVIESWNAYNNSYLFGKWHDISDMDEDEFDELMRDVRKDHEKKLNKALSCNDEICEEWFCPDWEISFNGQNIKYNYGSIEPSPWTLFKFIQTYKELETEDDTTATVILNLLNQGEEIENAKSIAEEGFLVEVGHNVNEDVGYYFANELCAIEIPENLASYFDYEAYGRDIIMDFYAYEIETKDTTFILLAS